MEIKFIYSNALLSKIQIGLRVLKIIKRCSITNKPQAAALGTILLRNEVVVRELDKVASCVLLIICRTCLSKSGFRKKREKTRVSTNGTYLRDKTSCARWWAV